MANLYTVGSSGPEVTKIQNALNAKLFPTPKLVTDGIFGSLTLAAVKAFQKQAGIDIDGIVGPITRAALGIPEPKSTYTHRIRLNFRSIAITDVSFESILSHTKAVYAQYSIRVDFANGQSLALSAAQANSLKQIDGQCKWEVTGGEYSELLNLGGPIPASDIGVYFVDKFSESINGCGGHLKDKPACIVAKAGTKYCTAHEVCHVLLGSTFSPVHITDTNNLMHPVDIQRSKVPVLTEAQVARVKASSMCVAI
jgi:hypothetical protein